MPAPSDFSPVILLSEDLKSIHAALVSAGRTDLVSLIERKFPRSPSELRYLAARSDLDEAEFDFDDVPVVSEGDAGAYVSCRVWVSREHADEVAGEAEADRLDQALQLRG